MYPVMDMLEAKGWKVSTSLHTDYSRSIIAQRGGVKISIDYSPSNDEFFVVRLLPDGSGKRVDVNADGYLPEDLLPAIEEVAS